MKTFLLLSVMAASSMVISAQVALPHGVEKKPATSSLTHQSVRMEKRQAGVAQTPQPNQASNAKLQYQRPRGQFYFAPYPVGESDYWFPGGGLVVTPFADLTFNNLSSMPNENNYSWDYLGFVEETGWTQVNYKGLTLEESFPRGTFDPVVLKYSSFTFGDKSYRYDNNSYTEYDQMMFGVKSTGDYIAEMNEEGSLMNFEGCFFPLSPKYFGAGTRMRNSDSNAGYMRITGSAEDGSTFNWWGNGSRYSATATRFEKPDAPYILKGVYIYGFWYTTGEVKFPVKVYQLLENASSGQDSETGQRYSIPAVLGDLIVEGEATVISGPNEDNPYEGYLECKFTETDETGAVYEVEPEISEDIVVVVENINDPAIKYGSLLISWDKFDEGYGNIGYLGEQASDNPTEDKPILHGLLDFFTDPMPSAPTVFIDAARGWIFNATVDATDEWTASNAGEQKTIILYTSEASEDGMNWEPTLENGEALPDWLEINMQDEYEDAEFTGYVYVEMNVEALPEGVKGREAVVKFSFPTATYLYTVKQGESGAVEVVGVNGEIVSSQYFDLQGREVKNVPENGIFIQKSTLSDGSVKSVKVIR